VFYISLGMMFLVLVPKIGVNINGASRWVRVGFLNFQPVEFFKLGFVLYLAHWLQKNNSKLQVKNWLEGLLPFLIMLFVSAGLVTVNQKDMGSAMVIAMIGFGMYWISGVQLRLFTIALAAAVGSAVALVLLFPYRLSRVLTFLNSSDDPSGASYHINQALIGLWRLVGARNR
jgi:cell division protein FtsW